jgi:hypothetical protein
VGLIELDEQTHAYVRFAARVAGVAEADIVARAVAAYVEDSAPPAPDPWTPVPIHAVYREQRVDALFVPRTHRVAITSGPLEGQKFPSPSGAARAVVAALNPERGAVHTNGWRFWRLTETDDRLEVLRQASS